MFEALEIFKKFHNIEVHASPQVFRKGSEKDVNGVIYGTPLYFLNYNQKKPYLKALTFPNKGVYYCTHEEALLRHNFYQWLMKQKKQKPIYMCHDGELAIGEHPGKSCIFIVTDIVVNMRGKRLYVIDYDILP